MLRRPDKTEFGEYVEKAYMLAVNPESSSFPSYADGIKTEEDFFEVAKKGFESDGDEILVFEKDGEMLGWIHFYVLTEDRYIGFEAFETDGCADGQTAELVAYLKEKYDGFEINIGFPSQNEKAIKAFFENGFEKLEESAVNILFFGDYEPRAESEFVAPLTKEKLPLFKKLHDPVEMYWNTERLTKAYFDGDKWRIYIYEDGERTAALYFVFAENIAEIFGLDFSDGFDAEAAEALLATALNEAKKKSGTKAMYWFSEDSRETELSKKAGAKKFTDYKAYKKIL